MNCRKLCTAATLFVLFPALELSSAGPDQGQEYYMPGWIWWVIILIALVSIFWWYLYLRPGQAAEILELEQQVGGGHGHDNHSMDDHGHSAHEGDPHAAVTVESFSSPPEVETLDDPEAE